MKKNLIYSAVAASMFFGGIAFFNQNAYAHGYVETPASRGYQGALDRNTLGWTAAYNRYGSVITNPQSLEFKKGFPQAGPADGRIASAEAGSGQIQDYVLDETGADRWKKQDIKSGMNTFTWKYTAPHRTTKWHYYITKQGWNPNEPLKRSAFELIGEVKHDGSTALNNLSHKINVPSDRKGYHVILAVWDVEDTANAFYNVIDVNVDGLGTVTPPPIETAPSAPQNVQATDVTTSSLRLKWAAVTGAAEYNIYRNGAKVATVSNTQFNDSNLKEATNYTYQVEAVGSNGKVSEKSAAVKVTTASSQTEDNQKPTAPTNLHAMNTTETSVDLMWTASTHFLGVKNYEIYRNGTKIATATQTRFNDTGLQPNTTYTYQVKAVSVGGNVSEASKTFSVTTKEKPAQGETTWDSNKAYFAGDRVRYNGKTYEAKWWSKGARPDVSDAWKLVDGKENMEWNKDKAYTGGSIVTYEGKEYKAKWWTRGDVPGRSGVWQAR